MAKVFPRAGGSVKHNEAGGSVKVTAFSHLPLMAKQRSTNPVMHVTATDPISTSAMAARLSVPRPLLFSVFVLSGISALIYQLVWQRSLLTIYGSNVESVAMVVAAFMVGLGIGSLAGGAVSAKTRLPLVLLFSLAECGIGLYGLASLGLFHWVGTATLGAGSLLTGLLAFLLIFLPTLMMGATLPLLVAQLVKETASVGRSVSWLYAVNTFGAALGAFLAAFVILGRFGQSGSVKFAAALNFIAAVTILLVWFRRQKA
jgi:spermidine synthase